MPGVITDRRQGITTGAAVKVPCKVATTVNITLEGEQSVDGVSCTAGDRVLVKSQTNSVENGIYTVNTGSWRRAPDWDGSLDVRQGTFVYVTDGATNKGFWYVTTANPIIPGTTSITIERASTILAAVSGFMQTLLDDPDAATAFNTLKQAATETATGVVELATNTEALAGTDTTRAVTSAGLASSKSLAGSGYMKFPGGLIAQWSTSVVTLNASGDGTVAWPIAFPTAFLGGVVCNGDPAAQGNVVFSINNTACTATTLAFSCRPNPGATVVRVNYISVGH